MHCKAFWFLVIIVDFNCQHRYIGLPEFNTCLETLDNPDPETLASTLMSTIGETTNSVSNALHSSHLVDDTVHSRDLLEAGANQASVEGPMDNTEDKLRFNFSLF
jgi:hypothetical protein